MILLVGLLLVSSSVLATKTDTLILNGSLVVKTVSDIWWGDSEYLKDKNLDFGELEPGVGFEEGAYNTEIFVVVPSGSNSVLKLEKTSLKLQQSGTDNSITIPLTLTSSDDKGTEGEQVVINGMNDSAEEDNVLTKYAKDKYEGMSLDDAKKFMAAGDVTLKFKTAGLKVPNVAGSYAGTVGLTIIYDAQ